MTWSESGEEWYFGQGEVRIAFLQLGEGCPCQLGEGWPGQLGEGCPCQLGEGWPGQLGEGCPGQLGEVWPG
jgi:hypothetical protein